MREIPDHVKIKLRNADSISSEIMELCLLEMSDTTSSRLSEISVRLGEFAVTLRSALNNMMWDFAEDKLKNILSDDEYEKLQWSHDFPIEDDKYAYKNSRSRIMRHISGNYPSIYVFLEKSQPYHDKIKLLRVLKVISNHTTHTIPIKTQPVRASDVSLIGRKPRIMGEQVLLPTQDRSTFIVYTPIPCFVRELNMFVSAQKKWVIFLIDIVGVTKPNLIPFLHMTNEKVHLTVTEFYSLW